MRVASPPAAPAAPPRTPAPAATLRPASDVPAVLTETIDEACTEPAEPWCKYMKKTKAGTYNIDAHPGAITVQTKIPNSAKGRKLAAKLCTYLGANHFDENATRLDYNHIHIFRGDTEQADCNTEDYWGCRRVCELSI